MSRCRIARLARWVLLSMLLCCTRAEAGLMPERTRLVFSQGERELSLRLANTNPHAVVVQSWVDQGEGSQAPDTVQSALFVLPAVQRLSPQAIGQVRVLTTGEPLPTDRESVFWLNLYEIPLLADAPQASAPRLLLGLNTQIKVFHRPHGLADPGPQWSDALHFRLQWQAGQWVLVCRNDSPYFASLASLRVSDGRRELVPRAAPDQMAPPYGEQVFVLPVDDATLPWQQPRLSFQLIDDDGRSSEHARSLMPPNLP
ncbi:molecular chaperone [Herbaspirillum sp. WGmk3]|uniref:fimbrial biogenesis chaperone n=1 Tax=Herbaspirillum sp. WGmk3 TaxID=2919925 RepID=UPI00209050C1|nr:molecular chaperone [Herbaspirillum sp. WGmk3]MCO4855733.1 molecular chaperone [Herbaspirillum sp. WGmk3]